MRASRPETSTVSFPWNRRSPGTLKVSIDPLRPSDTTKATAPPRHGREARTCEELDLGRLFHQIGRRRRLQVPRARRHHAEVIEQVGPSLDVGERVAELEQACVRAEQPCKQKDPHAPRRIAEQRLSTTTQGVESAHESKAVDIGGECAVTQSDGRLALDPGRKDDDGKHADAQKQQAQSSL